MVESPDSIQTGPAVSNNEGILFVVATPIGNRGDLTRRAEEVLREVDLIAAEDTRHSAGLLRWLGVGTSVQSLHEHNEARATPRLLRLLAEGRSVALISDAGTPLLSDPGYRLVRAARAAGIRVSPVPGPSAVTAALSVAGLATDRFAFEGFLPPRAAARREALARLREDPRTLVFFEAPHRVGETLADMLEAFGGQREAVLARELTKLYEEVRGYTLEGLLASVRAHPEHNRGEMVILVAGRAEPSAAELSGEDQRVLEVLLEELPLRQAANLAARLTGKRRNALYRRALEGLEGK